MQDPASKTVHDWHVARLRRLAEAGALAADPDDTGPNESIACDEVKHRLAQRLVGLVPGSTKVRPVICVNAFDGSGKPLVYDSITKLAEVLDVNAASICAAMSRGHRIRGMRVEYLERHL